VTNSDYILGVPLLRYAKNRAACPGKLYLSLR
jgi:hypothetical protein